MRLDSPVLALKLCYAGPGVCHGQEAHTEAWRLSSMKERQRC